MLQILDFDVLFKRLFMYLQLVSTVYDTIPLYYQYTNITNITPVQESCILLNFFESPPDEDKEITYIL